MFRVVLSFYSGTYLLWFRCGFTIKAKSVCPYVLWPITVLHLLSSFILFREAQALSCSRVPGLCPIFPWPSFTGRGFQAGSLSNYASQRTGFCVSFRPVPPRNRYRAGQAFGSSPCLFSSKGSGRKLFTCQRRVGTLTAGKIWRVKSFPVPPFKFAYSITFLK